MDEQTVPPFNRAAGSGLARLREELRTGRYRRQPARRVWLEQPGTTEQRPLGWAPALPRLRGWRPCAARIPLAAPRGLRPAVRERTVEAGWRHVLEPVFERDFAECRHGFRPGRGCREAVGRVAEWLSPGHVWCVDADLKSYVDTIPPEGRRALVKPRVVDGSVLTLVEQCLKAGVLEALQGGQPAERGTPQGAVISPTLANLHRNPLDHETGRRGWAMVRSADDLVVRRRSREAAEAVLNFLRDWTPGAGRTLHPTQTRIVNATGAGCDFLGWHFRGGQKWPRQKSRQQLQERLRPLTRRTHGRSLGELIAQANPILRGGHGYFRDSLRSGLSGPDGWVRRRWRALLRQREKRPGHGLSEADSRRWPNRWFAAQGLFSLEPGPRAYSQSR